MGSSSQAADLANPFSSESVGVSALFTGNPLATQSFLSPGAAAYQPVLQGKEMAEDQAKQQQAMIDAESQRKKDESTQSAAVTDRNNMRRRQAAAAANAGGRQSTILTASQTDLGGNAVTAKTLLGQ